MHNNKKMENTTMAATKSATEPTPAPKAKRRRLVNDQELLKKLLTLLERDKFTKEELAAKLELESPKQINDSLLLAAVKLAGGSAFLSNIIEKTGGSRARKGPQYSSNKGLIVPAWMFEGKELVDGQKYTMNFGIRTGIITLKPMDE